MLFDTHAHLDDDKFDIDREDIIAYIKDEGVSCLVNIGADMESSRTSVSLAEEHDFIYAAVGVHPYDAPELTDDDLEELRRLSKNEKVVAIGEIGLDYHFPDTDKEGQKEGFRKQIALAKELSLPYVVHDRDSHQDCYDIIKESGYFNGVMHCFSGSSEFAKQMTDLGFYISFAGTVTFKNAKKVKEAALTVPMDRILIETDCPYLSPEPHRGKRNNPANVRFVAEMIAEIKGIPFEEVCKITMENGKRFFGIEKSDAFMNDGNPERRLVK